MKKFLDLKRSIIDSKNEPTLAQTYLDSIRSSCYKLESPQITPRGKENAEMNINSRSKKNYLNSMADLMNE